MKRVISAVFSVLFLIALIPERALASSASIGTAPEMEDVEWILENGTFLSSEAKTVTSSMNEELTFNVDTYAVTEAAVGSTYSLPNGTRSVDYTSSTYQLWSEASVNGGGSNSYEDYDDSYSIIFRLTVNYSEITNSEGKSFRQMTNVSGLYSIEDTQMTVSSHRYILAQGGEDLNDNYTTYFEEFPLTVPLYTWTRSVSSTDFPYITPYFADGFQGARYHYTITRTVSGSSWDGYIIVSTIGDLSLIEYPYGDIL